MNPLKKFCLDNGLPLKLNKFSDITEVRDQDVHAACMAFAATDLLDIYVQKRTNQRIDLNTQELIDGLSIMDAFTYLKKFGITLRKNNSYIGINRQLSSKQYQPYPYNENERFKLPDFKYLHKDYKYLKEMILWTLSRDDLPAVGAFVAWGTAFATWTDDDGPFYSDPNSGYSTHAVLFTGYDVEDDDPLKNHIFFKNSYGVDWGINGYGKLNFNSISGLWIVKDHLTSGFTSGSASASRSGSASGSASTSGSGSA